MKYRNVSSVVLLVGGIIMSVSSSCTQVGTRPPSSDAGTGTMIVYVEGDAPRPGSYEVSQDQIPISLKRMVIAAGGLRLTGSYSIVLTRGGRTHIYPLDFEKFPEVLLRHGDRVKIVYSGSDKTDAPE